MSNFNKNKKGNKDIKNKSLYSYKYTIDVNGKRRRVYQKPENTRVACICEVRTANIVDNGRIIGTISEETNDAQEFDWVIKMDWKEFDRNPQSIPGIDTDLRLDEYIRAYVPAIVDERTLPDSRDGIWDELNELELNHNDRFEFMVRTHGRCGCNNLLIEAPHATMTSMHTYVGSKINVPNIKILCIKRLMQAVSENKDIEKIIVYGEGIKESTTYYTKVDAAVIMNKYSEKISKAQYREWCESYDNSILPENINLHYFNSEKEFKQSIKDTDNLLIYDKDNIKEIDYFC
jgi:hypothetical protein